MFFLSREKARKKFFFGNLRLSVIPQPFCRFSLDPREGNEQQKGNFVTDWSLKQRFSYNEKSLNIHVSWQCFGKGNVISSKRNQETIVTNVWVFAFFSDKTINFKGIEEKHIYTYDHLNLWIKYKMKSLKRDICCIVWEISLGCKK